MSSLFWLIMLLGTLSGTAGLTLTRRRLQRERAARAALEQYEDALAGLRLGALRRRPRQIAASDAWEGWQVEVEVTHHDRPADVEQSPYLAQGWVVARVEVRLRRQDAALPVLSLRGQLPPPSLPLVDTAHTSEARHGAVTLDAVALRHEGARSGRPGYTWALHTLCPGAGVALGRALGARVTSAPRVEDGPGHTLATLTTGADEATLVWHLFAHDTASIAPAHQRSDQVAALVLESVETIRQLAEHARTPEAWCAAMMRHADTPRVIRASAARQLASEAPAMARGVLRAMREHGALHEVLTLRDVASAMSPRDSLTLTPSTLWRCLEHDPEQWNPDEQRTFAALAADCDATRLIACPHLPAEPRWMLLDALLERAAAHPHDPRAAINATTDTIAAHLVSGRAAGWAEVLTYLCEHRLAGPDALEHLSEPTRAPLERALLPQLRFGNPHLIHAAILLQHLGAGPTLVRLGELVELASWVQRRDREVIEQAHAYLTARHGDRLHRGGLSLSEEDESGRLTISDRAGELTLLHDARAARVKT